MSLSLENQVVSLELSKRLKELGFKQESLWYHCQQYYLDVWIIDINKNSQTHRSGISAYTVAELGEILPVQLEVKYPVSGGHRTEMLSIFREKGKESWDVAYGTDTDQEEHWQQADTEADARARMLIHLKENNLIQPS